MKSIGYKLVKNYTQTAEKAPYTGMALPVGSLAFNNILTGMLDSGTFMTKATAEYFLKAFFEFAADEIGANVVRVSTGTVSLYPAISGSFPSEDASFDPLKNALYVGASVSQSLRERVASTMEPDFKGDAAGSSSVKISSVMDLASKTMGIIDGTKVFRLAGVDLTVPDGTDESLSLVMKDGLTKVCDITVSENDGGLYLTCALPETVPLAKGPYKIRLASHGLDPTAPLTVRTLPVTLVTAVARRPKLKVTALEAIYGEYDTTLALSGLENIAAATGYDSVANTFRADVYRNGALVCEEQFASGEGGRASCAVAGFEVGDTAKVVIHVDPAKTEYDPADAETSGIVTAE